MFRDDDDHLPKYGVSLPEKSKRGPIMAYEPFFGRAPDVGPLNMKIVPCSLSWLKVPV